MESLPSQLKSKRVIARKYENFMSGTNLQIAKEIENGQSNYWLNAIVLKDYAQRDLFLQTLNDAGVMCRPIWRLMNKLDMFSSYQKTELLNAEYLEDRVVNLPSSSLMGSLND